jgi:hypothetical protein
MYRRNKMFADSPADQTHTDRPMSEYEAVNYGINSIICDVLIELGADVEKLTQRIRDLLELKAEMGSRNGAATLEHLLLSIERGMRRRNS